MAGSGASGYQTGPGTVAQFSNATSCAWTQMETFSQLGRRHNCIRKISPDTAGIGIADDWQLAHFGRIGIDPNADPDHDGMSNYEEFWAGTDPNDPHSVFAIQPPLLVNNGQIQIRWQTVAGKTYAMKYSPDLVSWSALGYSVLGDGSVATVTETPVNPQNQQQYYRLIITGF